LLLIFLVSVRHRDTDLVSSHRYDRSIHQRLFGPFQHDFHQRNARSCRNVGKANNAAMRLLVDEDEFAEVRIDRDKNPTFLGGPSEKNEVAGVGTALARFDDVVTIGAKPFRQPTARTPIDHELHGVVTCTASRES
jgi:hypothetical protein